MKKVSIATFGCKVNQYESACILHDFRQQGYETVSLTQEADIYIINTCTVTGRTDYKSRNAIRRALEKKREKPEVKIIVTGCYAQLHDERIREMGEIDLIVDNNNKDRIFSFLQENRHDFIADTSLFETFTEQKTGSLFERTRAFVKIQDGCDYFCAYCTVPLARGKPRSRKLEEIITQIGQLAENGYREFVLTGINLGLYGKDFSEKDPYSLVSLLNEIEKIEKVKKIRLSSLEPQLLNDSILEYFSQSRKLCPHLHIPLQSGSDEILQAMGRPYFKEDYLRLLMKIKAILPDAAIGSDLILGLPGENEELFQETLSFIDRLPLVYLHIFPYSRRPGTKAARMSGIPQTKEVKQRSVRLSQLMVRKRREYITYLLKERVKMAGILERKRGEYWTALSDHYLRLYLCPESDVWDKGDLITCIPKREIYDGLEVVIDDRN
jgi:threonylcarbamoyladenosine tRNA methylthiotransferase MtaB